MFFAKLKSGEACLVNKAGGGFLLVQHRHDEAITLNRIKVAYDPFKLFPYGAGAVAAYPSDFSSGCIAIYDIESSRCIKVTSALPLHYNSVSREQVHLCTLDNGSIVLFIAGNNGFHIYTPVNDSWSAYTTTGLPYELWEIVGIFPYNNTKIALFISRFNHDDRSFTEQQILIIDTDNGQVMQTFNLGATLNRASYSDSIALLPNGNIAISSCTTRNRGIQNEHLVSIYSNDRYILEYQFVVNAPVESRWNPCRIRKSYLLHLLIKHAKEDVLNSTLGLFNTRESSCNIPNEVSNDILALIAAQTGTPGIYKPLEAEALSYDFLAELEEKKSSEERGYCGFKRGFLLERHF